MPPSIPRKRNVLSYTHAVYFIKVIGKPFVSHAFIEILSSLVETKLIFAMVQRALRQKAPKSFAFFVPLRRDIIFSMNVSGVVNRLLKTRFQRDY